MKVSPLKISIITVTNHHQDTLEQTIKSVISQDYPYLEYIIIDMESEDLTVSIINKYQTEINHWVSEKCQNYYDALNKGLEVASGDIVGILNADSFYCHPQSLTLVAHCFKNNPKIEATYANLKEVDRNNPQYVKKTIDSKCYQDGLFYTGWAPPFPTFFFKKNLIENHGSFNPNIGSSGAYEFLLRMIHINQIKIYYINKYLLYQSVSSKGNVFRFLNWTNKKEADIAWKVNALKPQGKLFLSNPLTKLKQYLLNSNTYS